MATRPADEEELQKREAIGVIRASRFVRKYAHSHKTICMETICDLHKEIFRNAWLEISGKLRTENLEITDSQHKPCHHSQVAECIHELDRELSERIAALGLAVGEMEFVSIDEGRAAAAVERVVRLAAWLHHQITYIHPFREGNGRTARLAANLILERYGLTGLSVKVEKENKNRYRNALAQIDQYQDYEPLVELMYDGLIDRYDGVALKYYEVVKK